MIERLFKKTGSHFILVMMLLTRAFNLVGGFLVVYYINLTLNLDKQVWLDLFVVASVLIVVATYITVWMAMRETRTLRKVLRQLLRDEPVDAAEGQLAGREAVTFPSRHHLHESIYVPLICVLVLCTYLRVVDGAPWNVAIQVTIAGFVGISSVLMGTFFASEQWVVPIIELLLKRGIQIDFKSLPAGKIQFRMNLAFGLTIAVTALMIGSLANQRAMEIITNPDPDQQVSAVASLREHTIYISLAAVLVGLALSHFLSRSVASRVKGLMDAMKHVQEGQLSERVMPAGNDEIDVLARQFNTMVTKLEQDDHTIRDLNVNLEQKVKLRTRQLSASKRSLQQSYRKLKDYDRLKTEFFSNVSHELRTPLTMILAPVERILNVEAGNMTQEVVSRLETVRINGHRLLKLINQLLDFAKLEAGHAQLRISIVDVNALVTELTTAMRPLAEQRELKLQVDLDGTIPQFGADQEKIDTVITNLLSNALKFTPAGGKVTVETARLEGRVRVSVTDTGVGIAPQDQERIFERFFQVDGSSTRDRPGTGLGMALSKEIVELHGGTLALASELGKGSCFTMVIPMAEVPVTIETVSTTDTAKVTLETTAVVKTDDSTRRQYQRFADQMECKTDWSTAGRASKGIPVGTPKVLVVDDTPEVLTAVAEVLADHYQVITAKDGGEGYETAKRELPDMIISDVMMPKVDGYEFCRRVKEDPQTATIPFVMLTAKADRSMKVVGLDGGADEYLAKPFDAKEMLARVRSMLRLRQMHKALDKRNLELQSTLSELRSTQAQLVQSEKMSSIGQLVAGLAHEINNSINAVYNGIQPLRTKSQKLEQLVAGALGANASTPSATGQEISKHFARISQLAEIIEHGASRTAQIVQDLKTFSHPGTETVETFNVHEALDVCLNLLSGRAKKRINVHRDFQADGLIQGPSGQINQVFMNLLSNAQDAIKGEGDITVSTRDADDRVAISVKDSGEGIPAHIQTKIFDPFFTTKPPGKGTGLGLSISYSLINRVGGSIQFQSSPDTGTEFVVTLPRCIDLRDVKAPAVEALATAFE